MSTTAPRPPLDINPSPIDVNPQTSILAPRHPYPIPHPFPPALPCPIPHPSHTRGRGRVGEQGNVDGAACQRVALCCWQTTPCRASDSLPHTLRLPPPHLATPSPTPCHRRQTLPGTKNWLAASSTPPRCSSCTPKTNRRRCSCRT
eukprot:364834-Chlamydomonas_euryale.AAC.8